MIKKYDFVFKLLFSISLFIFVLSKFYSFDFRGMKDIKYSYYFLGFSISFVTLWISALRWKLLSGYVSSIRLMKYILMSQFVTIALPSALFSDFARAYYLNKNKVHVSKSVSSVFWDRLIGVFALYCLFLIIVSDHAFGIYKVVVGLLFLAVLLFVFITPFILTAQRLSVLKLQFKNNKILIMIDRFYEVLSDLRNTLKFSNVSFLLAALIFATWTHLLNTVIFYCLFYAVDIQLKATNILLAYATVTLVTSLPISILGMGVRELSLITIMKDWNVQISSIILFSLLVYSIQVFWLFAGLIFYLREKKTY